MTKLTHTKKCLSFVISYLKEIKTFNIVLVLTYVGLPSLETWQPPQMSCCEVILRPAAECLEWSPSATPFLGSTAWAPPVSVHITYSDSEIPLHLKQKNGIKYDWKLHCILLLKHTHMYAQETQFSLCRTKWFRMCLTYVKKMITWSTVCF